jgi:hypothetical protein
MKKTNNNIASDQMPFTEFKLGGINIDTEYDEDTSIYNNDIDSSYRPEKWEPGYFQGLT